jgi:DNA polymerase III delta subunit
VSTKGSTFKQFIVSFGGNDFALDRDIDQACKSKRRIIRLDGDGLTESALLEQCQSYNDEPRTLIVDNAQLVAGSTTKSKVKGKGKEKPSKELSQLKAFIDERDPRDQTLVLMAVVRSEKLPEVWELAGNKGAKYQRSLPKPWDTSTYTAFIAKEAMRHSVSIDPKAIDMLFLLAGNDFYRLSNEVRKLAIYVGQPGTITIQHIDLVTTRTPQAQPHKIADAVLSKDRRKALELFSVFYSNEGDSGCIGLTFSLMSRVEKLVEIKSLQAKNFSSQDIASLLKLSQWPYDTLWAPMASKHDLLTLVGYMGQLCKLDSYVKLGHSKRTMVELTLLSISK